MFPFFPLQLNDVQRILAIVHLTVTWFSMALIIFIHLSRESLCYMPDCGQKYDRHGNVMHHSDNTEGTSN